MTTAEINKLLKIVFACYPAFYGKMPLDEKQTLQSVWETIFAEESYEVIKRALLTIISYKNDYPPSIAEIRERLLVEKGENAAILDSYEAWGLVLAAVRKYGRIQADIATKSLPLEVAKCLRDIGGFVTICMTENITVYQSQFIKAFDIYRQKKLQHRKIPETLRASGFSKSICQTEREEEIQFSQNFAVKSSMLTDDDTVG